MGGAGGTSKVKVILLTGGAGFIGSRVLQELNKRGIEEVAIVDSIPVDDPRWTNLSDNSFHEYIDVADWKKVSQHRSFKQIVHLGANSDPNATDFNSLHRSNTLFTRNLWEYAGRMRATFVYASSAATYGSGSQGFSDTLDAEQLSKLQPLSVYAMTKHLFDSYAMRQSQLSEAKAPKWWYGLKLFNVYGPGELHKGVYASMISRMICEAIIQQRITLFEGSEDFLRDFIYVGDVVRIILKFLNFDDSDENSAGIESGIYNVGTGKQHSYVDVAKRVFEVLGIPERIVYKPMPDDIALRFQKETKANTSKLRGPMNTGRPTSIASGVEKTAKALKEANPGLLRGLL